MKLAVKTDVFKKGLVNADTKEVLLECVYDLIEIASKGEYVIAGRYENNFYLNRQVWRLVRVIDMA